METIIAGKKIEFGVDEKSGKFKARYNGEDYEHITLQGLKSAIERQVKKKPLNIPVIKIWRLHYEELEIEKCTIIGVHSGNRNLILRMEDGSTEQWRGSRGELFHASMNIKTLKGLYRAVVNADKALEKFKKENSFDHHAAIQKFMGDDGE